MLKGCTFLEVGRLNMRSTRPSIEFDMVKGILPHFCGIFRTPSTRTSLVHALDDRSFSSGQYQFLSGSSLTTCAWVAQVRLRKHVHQHFNTYFSHMVAERGACASKANDQRVVLLERTIADEQTERRDPVSGTEGQMRRREEALEALLRKEMKCLDAKQQEVDRLTVLLRTKEQVSGEHLMMVHRCHAVVVGHEAEMRHLRVLLECEREETKRKLTELRRSYAAGEATCERRLDTWKMSYEDDVKLVPVPQTTDEIAEAWKLTSSGTLTNALPRRRCAGPFHRHRNRLRMSRYRKPWMQLCR